MYEDNKGLRFLRRVYIAFFVIAAGVNVFFLKQMSFMNIAAIAVWVYGLLCYLGYVKKVERKEGNRIVYATSVPILQIVAVRVIQFLIGKFLHIGMKEIEVVPLFACYLLDIVLLVLAILDSGSYYYEGIIEQDTDDHAVVTIENNEK